MKIALLGFGTVARGVANLIEQNKALIKQRLGQDVSISYVFVRAKKDDCKYPQSTDLDEILQSDCDVVCELLGGIDFAYECIKKALKAKKHVITANKALLSLYRYEIEDMLECGQFFGYEASVAGGVPIIKIIKDGLAANEFLSIKGILNGTSNYILSQMQQCQNSYESALKQAQELGYAEADPTLDVNGMDAAHKLCILASLAYGIRCNANEFLVQGISELNASDFEFAKEFDYSIKLLAIAKKQENGVSMRVHPVLISKNNILASVNGSMNAILLKDNALGESLYYGAGAGSLETASAVMCDIMQLSSLQNRKMLGFFERVDTKIIPSDELVAKYYLRLLVDDKIGVLSELTKLMSEEQISIDSLIQRPNKEDLRVIFVTTHPAKESKIQKLIANLQKQNFVKEKINLIRIEE